MLRWFNLASIWDTDSFNHTDANVRQYYSATGVNRFARAPQDLKSPILSTMLAIPPRDVFRPKIFILRPSDNLEIPFEEELGVIIHAKIQNSTCTIGSQLKGV